GTRMHDPRNVITSGGLKDVERTLYVGPHIAAWRFIGIRDRDQRCEMQYDVLPLYHPVYEVAVFDITAHHLRAAADGPFEQRQIADQRAGVVAHHGGNIGAGLDKGLYQMTADEATGPGYQDLRALPHDRFSRCIIIWWSLLSVSGALPV